MLTLSALLSVSDLKTISTGPSTQLDWPPSVIYSACRHLSASSHVPHLQEALLAPALCAADRMKDAVPACRKPNWHISKERTIGDRTPGVPAELAL